VIDLDKLGLASVMRGKDYGLLDQAELQARLALSPDQVVTHPETGTTRALFDCLDVALTGVGPRIRVIVATHPATGTSARIGTTREGMVYELFWTILPPLAFTPADVLDLYFHRGGFETVLSDEDTAGVLTPPMERSSGKSSPNGCGISASSWGIISLQLPCVPRSLQKPKPSPRPLPHPRNSPPESRKG